jgi:hypothetical protein
LDDIQQFYRERSVIEKEYSAKLAALAKKYYERKAKKSSSLSVGDTPAMTPGSLERYVLRARQADEEADRWATAHPSQHGRHNSQLSNPGQRNMIDLEENWFHTWQIH